MKAAHEEVQKVVGTMGVVGDPSTHRINLTRDQLDNMPVLGTIISYCSIKTNCLSDMLQ